METLDSKHKRSMHTKFVLTPQAAGTEWPFRSCSLGLGNHACSWLICGQNLFSCVMSDEKPSISEK